MDFIILQVFLLIKKNNSPSKTMFLEYLNRLDIVVEKDRHFTLDKKLNNKKDINGYKSYFTIYLWEWII